VNQITHIPGCLISKVIGLFFFSVISVTQPCFHAWDGGVFTDSDLLLQQVGAGQSFSHNELPVDEIFEVITEENEEDEDLHIKVATLETASLQQQVNSSCHKDLSFIATQKRYLLYQRLKLDC
jgi:hypothetical protein